MPKFTRPEHVEQFFEQHAVPVAEKPSFYWKAIKPAFQLGFRISETESGDVVVFTPHHHKKVYRGFNQTKYHMGMILLHAMLSNRLH